MFTQWYGCQESINHFGFEKVIDGDLGDKTQGTFSLNMIDCDFSYFTIKIINYIKEKKDIEISKYLTLRGEKV